MWLHKSKKVHHNRATTHSLSNIHKNVSKNNDSSDSYHKALIKIWQRMGSYELKKNNLVIKPKTDMS